jgi:hypothetical protein
MDLEEAKKTLNRLRTADRTTQYMYRDEILEAFKVFWSNYPDMKSFSQQVKGLVFTPEMFYIMVKEPSGKWIH